MSKNEARELAKKYIQEQKKVLESHGDSVARGKLKEAVTAAQKTFEMIAKSSSQIKRHTA